MGVWLKERTNLAVDPPVTSEGFYQVLAPQAEQLIVHRHTGRPAALAPSLRRLQAQESCNTIECNNCSQVTRDRRSYEGASLGLLGALEPFVTHALDEVFYFIPLRLHCSTSRMAY